MWGSEQATVAGFLGHLLGINSGIFAVDLSSLDEDGPRIRRQDNYFERSNKQNRVLINNILLLGKKVEGTEEELGRARGVADIFRRKAERTVLYLDNLDNN